jgi:uncharacterized protein
MQTKPTEAKDRILFLDALRGFALLGVLVANMYSHGGYFFYTPLSTIPTVSLDKTLEWCLHFLVDGKFYSLFSLLFGIGFALQLERKGQNIHSFFLKRLSILFLFGVLHALFLFVGDILMVYAITGVFLLFFKKNHLKWAIFFLALPVVEYAIFTFTLELPPPPPKELIQNVIETQRYGNLHQMVLDHWAGLTEDRIPHLIFTGRFFKVLAMFLLGVYVAQKGMFKPGHRDFMKRVFRICLPIGLILNLGMAMLMETDYYYSLHPIGILESILYVIGVPTLSLAYASGFYLLDPSPLTKLFVPVGRMALTNYLTQSLICKIIFAQTHSWGGVPLTYLVLLGILIFLVQIVWSHLWFRYFNYGPMEWLWRKLTYGKSFA